MKKSIQKKYPVADNNPNSTAPHQRSQRKIQQKIKQKSYSISQVYLMANQDCQYPVVSRVAKGLKWKLQSNAEATDWDVFWTDNAVQPETLLKM